MNLDVVNVVQSFMPATYLKGTAFCVNSNHTPASIAFWRKCDALCPRAVFHACKENKTEEACWLLRHGFAWRSGAAVEVVRHRNWTILEALGAVPLAAIHAMVCTGWTAGLLYVFGVQRVAYSNQYDTVLLVAALTRAPTSHRKAYVEFFYDMGRGVTRKAMWTLENVVAPHDPETADWVRTVKMRRA